MKNKRLKNLIGFMAIAAVFSAPTSVRAEVANMETNAYRIKNSYGTVVDWGESYKTHDDKDVPATITYDGETYIHIDLAAEDVYDGQASWNGDSSTYTMTSTERTVYGSGSITKDDEFGNSWLYTVRSHDDGQYLEAIDSVRGYKRLYKLVSDDAFEFTEDGVWFATTDQNNDADSLRLTKIYYKNAPDTQDGITYEIFETNRGGGSHHRVTDCLIADGNLYFIHKSENSYKAGMPHSESQEGYPAGRIMVALNVYDVQSIIISQLYEATSPYVNMHSKSINKLIDFQDGYLYFEVIDIALTETWRIKTDGSEPPSLIKTITAETKEIEGADMNYRLE